MSKYIQSREIWKAWREREKEKTGNDPIVGFCLWEFEHENFKLECWNVSDGKSYSPEIFQFWKEGNGFTTYEVKG